MRTEVLGRVARCLPAFVLAACSGADDPATPAGGIGGSIPTGPGGNAGASAIEGRAGSDFGGAGNIAGAAATAGSTSVAGSLGVGATGTGGATTAGSSVGGASGPTPGTAGAAGSATAGSAGTHTRDHCVDGYDPDPADDAMMDGPAAYTKNNQTDTTVQPGVITWMQNHVWQSAHYQWHNIRRCNSPLLDTKSDGNLDPCKRTDLVPVDQEGKGPGDGFQFLAMHRHMIQSLKQLFPKHQEQFEGWERFPQKKEELPPQWQAEWTPFDAQMAQKMAMADDPAKYIAENPQEAERLWPTEGDFGQWLQTTSGIHGALHFKWTRAMNDDHGLGNPKKNIDNYMFWKMHGWIDKIWDRYRATKGKTPNDPDIKDAVLRQCREMDQLALLVKPDLTPDPGTCPTPPPKQTGFFVERIRPIFESATSKCTGCHGASGGMANLSLGGSECVESSDIVARLVDKASATGGQFKLVSPGEPDKSWLYLLVTNKAASAGCVPTGGNQCKTGLMPQGAPGVTLTQAEQDALRQWITDGAKPPQ